MINYGKTTGIRGIAISLGIYLIICLIVFHFIFNENLIESLTSHIVILFLLLFSFQDDVFINGSRLKVKVFKFITSLDIDIQSIIKVESIQSQGFISKFKDSHIAIYYNKYDSQNISIKERDKFIEDLKRINPKIQSVVLPY